MLAVVLSGGGANGAYEVGALSHILKHASPDAYCGVSVGAINSAFMSQFHKSEDLFGVKLLQHMWKKLDTTDIYKKWYLGMLWYLPALWKGSVYNTKPVRDLISGNLDKEQLVRSGKFLRVIGVSLNTGECKMWTERDNDIIEGVQASSSYPVFFSPIRIRGSIYSDGGLRNITPLKAAIDLGAMQIIVVTCSPKSVTFHKDTSPSTIEQLMRTLDIMCSEINRDDLRAAQMHNELAKAKAVSGKQHAKRWVDITVIQPKTFLGDSLDFSPKKNRELMQRGYEDAKAVMCAKFSQ